MGVKSPSYFLFVQTYKVRKEKRNGVDFYGKELRTSIR